MKPESGHPTDQTPGRTPGADRDETLAEAALRTTFARVKRAILFAPVLALLIAALPVILSSTTELYLGGCTPIVSGWSARWLGWTVSSAPSAAHRRAPATPHRCSPGPGSPQPQPW